MNDYLKELAEMVGLDNPVHQTHYKGNERIETILPKYAVLSTHAAMKPYIDIADDIKANAMSKFNQL